MPVVTAFDDFQTALPLVRSVSTMLYSLAVLLGAAFISQQLLAPEQVKIQIFKLLLNRDFNRIVLRIESVVQSVTGRELSRVSAHAGTIMMSVAVPAIRQAT